MNQSIIKHALHWGYDKALKGGLLDSAFDLANDYLQKHSSPYEAVSSLINWQTAKCATTGFLTGCGGLLTLPVSLPANMASVLFMQLRMIAAIAIMSGYDPRSDQVQSLAFTCLTGNAATEILKAVGVKMGQRITQKAMESISYGVLIQINEVVYFRLVTKFARTGMVNLGRAIPIASGILCGAIDGASTKLIGKTAQKVFLPQSQSIIVNRLIPMAQ